MSKAAILDFIESSFRSDKVRRLLVTSFTSRRRARLYADATRNRLTSPDNSATLVVISAVKIWNSGWPSWTLLPGGGKSPASIPVAGARNTKPSTVTAATRERTVRREVSATTPSVRTLIPNNDTIAPRRSFLLLRDCRTG